MIFDINAICAKILKTWHYQNEMNKIISNFHIIEAKRTGLFKNETNKINSNFHIIKSKQNDCSAQPGQNGATWQTPS